MKTVGATLWALEWAWHPAETNLRCARNSPITNPSSERSYGRTERRTD